MIKKFKNIKNVKDRNGHSNHQKVMKQVTMYKIPHMHVTTEAMTVALNCVRINFAFSDFVKLSAIPKHY